MVEVNALVRMDRKISAYIEKYVNLAVTEKKEEAFFLFDNLNRFFPYWTIMTCPMMHPGFSYVSANCEQTFGYDREFVMNNCRPDKFFTHIHNADQEDLKECFAALHEFMLSIPPEEHYAYRCVFHYRFRKSNGQYMYMHDEKATLNLKGGNLYYALLRDISDQRVFSGVRAEFFKNEDGLKKIREFKPSSERLFLSKREQQLVGLIKQGLSTKEMAWYLNISHHTVRNIKSKLFQKFQVNNSIELLNVAV